jgi:RNA polymerase sigma-70 factor (ECF subfamily)
MSDPHAEPSTIVPEEEPSSRTRTGAPSVSDELLLHELQMRDEQALGQLYDRYGETVFTLALRVVGDRSLAEEVTHEVFLRCWNGLDQFDATRGTVPAWLFGITRDRAIDAVRGRERRERPDERDPVTAPAAGEATPPDRADEVGMRTMVGLALNELAEPQRVAIELAYYVGLTQAEVATRLGEPLGAVKARIRDGLRRLRRALVPAAEPGPVRDGGAR